MADRGRKPPEHGLRIVGPGFDQPGHDRDHNLQRTRADRIDPRDPPLRELAADIEPEDREPPPEPVRRVRRLPFALAAIALIWVGFVFFLQKYIPPEVPLLVSVVIALAAIFGGGGPADDDR
ncbi:MAG: hypothetical protein AAGG07_03135 [Planctomycetota bacterium]